MTLTVPRIGTKLSWKPLASAAIPGTLASGRVTIATKTVATGTKIALKIT
ncbi:MAG TPA: hypothetical protein VNS09_23820 [Solirubrobacter sp.]|nr:hypothetical protein [Solirubrobacter sp.]